MEGCFLPRQLVQVSIFNQNAIGHWVFFFFFLCLCLCLCLCGYQLSWRAVQAKANLKVNTKPDHNGSTSKLTILTQFNRVTSICNLFPTHHS